MEHKSDTMFDIVQNLAKEISALNTQQAQLLNLHSHPSTEFGGGGMFMPPIFMHQSAGPMGFQMSECENERGDLEPVVEELDNEEDDDTDSETDDSDDESYDSDDSILFTGEDVDIELSEIDKQVLVVQEDIETDAVEVQLGSTDSENFQKIKVEDDDILPIVSQELNDTETRIERQDTLVEEELPVPETEVVTEAPSVVQESPDESIATTSQDDYKKLSLNELKKLVAAKGLATKDLNKLKRQDLLKLLQAS